MHQKPFLPQKICPVCNRSFSWRKKWEKNWEEVRYCSQRCRQCRSTREVHASQ
ncbi:DUF2256 domain-containing protein [Robiginitalea marina]|uniref:DUF2256 domain-containing protein n=1 Tax=Robiginitalea marina TaxID=2954105 RepID=A0ABT1AZT0_9FLAO|nr:DUF2256 domain-containing protein [Robiginitalea marina]MCO5724838.1 DUF2256 domain-containing protein [Robiginitalea marina]